MTLKLVSKEEKSKPYFRITHLPPETKLSLHLYAYNAKGNSTAVGLETITGKNPHQTQDVKYSFSAGNLKMKMKSSFIFKWPIFIINFATSLKLTFLGQIYPLEMLQSCLTCWTYDFKVQFFFSYCIMLFFICRLIWMVVDNVNPEVYINVLLKSMYIF